MMNFNYFSEFNLIRSKKRLMILFAIIFLLFITGVIFKNHLIKNNSSLQKQNNAVIISKLNEINEELIIVKDQSSEKNQVFLLQKLQKDISSIKSSFGEIAKTSDIKNISDQIITAKTELNGKMDEVKRFFSENIGEKKYLEANILPFQVLTIDVIAGQSYVSIDYLNHVLPLSIGDMLAGWRVTDLNYGNKVAEFVNAKNQFIRVTMQGI